MPEDVRSAIESDKAAALLDLARDAYGCKPIPFRSIENMVGSISPRAEGVPDSEYSRRCFAWLKQNYPSLFDGKLHPSHRFSANVTVFLSIATISIPVALWVWWRILNQ